MFGYVGDVLMPSVVLSQFVTALDLAVYGRPDSDRRLAYLAEFVKEQADLLPESRRQAFEIVHCARQGESLETRFRVAVTRYTSQGECRVEFFDAPQASAELVLLGSGKADVADHLGKWRRSEVSGTSRAIFGAFTRSVISGVDPLTATPVQLVGLRRKGPGKVFGIWHADGRYLAGRRVGQLDPSADVEWFNERFERCNGQSGAVIGQLQPVPRSLDR